MGVEVALFIMLHAVINDVGSVVQQLLLLVLGRIALVYVPCICEGEW